MKFAPGAWRYALPPIVVAPFALIFSTAASVVALLTGISVLAFFRDPERTPPPTGVVSPADGTVSVLREEGERVRLGVFMNVWHVHVIRAPLAGTVGDVDHSPGAHRPAFSKDSDRNEKVRVRFDVDGAENRIDDRPQDESDDENAEPSGVDEENAEPSDGDDEIEPSDDEDETEQQGDHDEWEVTFIAGAFARRIHPYVQPGDSLERGERIGHIAFGSRVDILFPPSVDREDVAVSIGDKMTAGESVVLESPSFEDGNLTAFEMESSESLDEFGSTVHSDDRDTGDHRLA